MRQAGSVVAVHGERSGPYGVGFLASEDTLVTCAHVVCEALGLSSDHPDPPEGSVTLEFLLLAGRTRITARVVTWRANGGEKPDDIAVLRLDGQPPAGAEPVRLMVETDLWNHRVAAFGVPRDNEQDGAWATGELRGHRAGGLIQVDDDHPESGFTIQQGFSGSPVWDEKAGGVVGMVISASQRRKFACIVPTAALLDVLPSARTANPYRGLLSFREKDAELFFGRDALADTLAEKVRTRRVTVVVGPSGFGKSSLVAAGVLPRLRKRPELAVAGPIRPRGDPANEIAGAFVELLQPDDTPTQQLADRPAMAEMIAGGRLDEVVGKRLDRDDATEVLLIIDQLEEALDRGSEAVTALAPVIAGASALESRFRVLLVIRSDFLDRALAHPELAVGMREVSTVGAMTREQLHDAVAGPLRDGVAFETGLDQLIVAEVATAPGQLPLLQSVLDQLWRQQEAGKLTHRAYTTLGGVSGALARYAEQKGWRELEEGDRAVAKRLFMRLVRVDPDLPATRRPVRRNQIGAKEWRLAQRLVNARLLVSGRLETVELAHEALITHWDRLRGWIERDREFRVWKEGFQELAARVQKNSAGGRRNLLDRAEVNRAKAWQRTRPDDFAESERTLIRKSLWAWRTRWLKPVATVLVPTLFAGYLWWAGAFDSNGGDPGEKLAMDLSSTEPTTDAVLQKTIAAYDTSPDNEYTVRELFDRYEATRGLAAVLTEPRENVRVEGVAASADGRVVVARSAAGATLWRGAGRRMVPADLHVPPPDDVSMTADGRVVALAGDGRVRLFDDRGRPTRDFAVPGPRGGAPSARMVVAVAGGMVATWRSDEPAVRLWDLAGRSRGSLPVGKVTGLRMWFAADHRTMVTWTAESGEVRTWDMTTRTSRRMTDVSHAAAVNAAGDTLASCQVTGDKTLVRVHKLDGTGEVTELSWDGRYCRYLTIDPSGRYLSFPYYDLAYVYDVATERTVATYQMPDSAEDMVEPVLTTSRGGVRAVHPAGPSTLVYDVPFGSLDTYPAEPAIAATSRDGDRIATVTVIDDHTNVTLWDGRSHRFVAEATTSGEPASVEFDASGRYLVVAFTDRHDVEIRAVPSMALLHTISLPAAANVAPPEVHLDERGHVLASHAGEIGSWDLATGERAGRAVPAAGPRSGRGTTSFAVSPEGDQVIAVSPDGRGLDKWNLAANLSWHVSLGKERVAGVVGTPWPERVLVLRQPDNDSTRLELWDLTKSRPTDKVLLSELGGDYTVKDLRASVGFDREQDRIVHVSGQIDTWYGSGDAYTTLQYSYAGRTPLDVLGTTTTLVYADSVQAITLEPDRWRDRLCDLAGRPDHMADLPDIPDGVRTTDLCPLPAK